MSAIDNYFISAVESFSSILISSVVTSSIIILAVDSYLILTAISST